jgi:hypothetical protein
MNLEKGMKLYSLKAYPGEYFEVIEVFGKQMPLALLKVYGKEYEREKCIGSHLDYLL